MEVEYKKTKKATKKKGNFPRVVPLPNTKDDSILLSEKEEAKKEYNVNGLVLREGLNIVETGTTRYYIEIFGNKTYITSEESDVFEHLGEIHPVRKQIKTKDLKFYL